MRKMLRWFGYGAGGIAALLLLAALYIWYASSSELSRVHAATPERLGPATAAELADAPRQARIQGCLNCHGPDLGGKVMFEAPNVARIWAPNLTEIAARASDEQLAQAIRQGIGIDGRALYVMPSAQYSRLSDGEVAALIAFLRAQPRAGGPTPSNEYGPVGRFALATGRFVPSAPELVAEFRRKVPFDAGPEHARGRRIAAVTCSECHGGDLAGHQPAPDIDAPDLLVAGAYDLDAFKALLRTGATPDGRRLGLMREVAEIDLNVLRDDEIEALHGYLVARAERMPQ